MNFAHNIKILKCAELLKSLVGQTHAEQKGNRLVHSTLSVRGLPTISTKLD